MEVTDGLSDDEQSAPPLQLGEDLGAPSQLEQGRPEVTLQERGEAVADAMLQEMVRDSVEVGAYVASTGQSSRDFPTCC